MYLHVHEAKRCGGFGLYGNEGCCGQWSDPAQESATGCSNCCGGFGSPISCGCGGCGGCSTLNFPCTFGACVNNPCCECCKEKPPKGKCQWPCYWPCCCECTPPQFKFKPLEAKPLCHCNQGSNGGGKRDSTKKRSIKTRRCGCGGPIGGFGYGSPWSQNFGYGFGYPFPFGGNWGFLYPYHF